MTKAENVWSGQLFGFLNAHSAVERVPDSTLAECALAINRLRVAPDLMSPSPFPRLLAIELLAESGDVLDAAPLLVSVLQSTHPKNVDLHLRGVEFGALGQTLRVSVYHRVVDLDRTIHLAAARGVLAIDPDDPLAAVAHAYLVSHGDLAERATAALALSTAPAVPSEAITILLRAIENEGPSLD